MTIEIRTARPDEYAGYVECLGTAFLDRLDVAAVTRVVSASWDPSRTWAAFDGARICGTFRSWATEITVPGGAILPASAVAAVTVLPTYRRRGILTSLAAAEHAAIRERGEAVGLLYASEARIYGRFGYGPGCRVATWTLDASRTSFHGDPVSGIELVATDAAAVDTIRGVFEAWRARQPGEIRRREFRWQDDLGLRENGFHPPWKGFLAIHRDASGNPDGYARYRAEEKFVDRQPAGLIKVDELHALTDEANAALWRFLAETDLVTTVRAEGRSPSDRLPWLLTNARAAIPSDIGDGMWVRLFDVAAGARGEDVRARGPRRGRGHRCRAGRAAAPRPRRLARRGDMRPHRPLAGPHAAGRGAGRGLPRGHEAARRDDRDRGRRAHAGSLATLDALLRTADEPWCSTFF